MTFRVLWASPEGSILSSSPVSSSVAGGSVSYGTRDNSIIFPCHTTDPWGLEEIKASGKHVAFILCKVAWGIQNSV